jgi:hypothetical protein
MRQGANKNFLPISFLNKQKPLPPKVYPLFPKHHLFGVSGKSSGWERSGEMMKMILER